MIETIAFDFGKVIGYFDHGRTLGKLTAHTDLSEDDMFSAIYGGDLEDAFESGQISDLEFLRRFRELCRLDCDDDFLVAAIADIFWPNDALCALIPALKQRYRLVLGSNTNAIHARRFVRQFVDALRHFDGLVLSHEIGVRKPDRGFFDQVLRVGRCPPDRCIFVDDLPENVAGARACGLHGVLYTDIVKLRATLEVLGVNLEET